MMSVADPTFTSGDQADYALEYVLTDADRSVMQS